MYLSAAVTRTGWLWSKERGERRKREKEREI
jgi:hypothetical protein